MIAFGLVAALLMLSLPFLAYRIILTTSKIVLDDDDDGSCVLFVCCVMIDV